MDNRFSNESSVIFLGISPQTFLFIDLKDYAAAYSLNAGDLQYEIPRVRKLLLKQPDPLKSIVKFLSFLCSYKAAFDCLYNLLLMSVRHVKEAPQNETSKNILRNSMNDNWVSDLAEIDNLTDVRHLPLN